MARLDQYSNEMRCDGFECMNHDKCTDNYKKRDALAYRFDKMFDIKLIKYEDKIKIIQSIVVLEEKLELQEYRHADQMNKLCEIIGNVDNPMGRLIDKYSDGEGDVNQVVSECIQIHKKMHEALAKQYKLEDDLKVAT